MEAIIVIVSIPFMINGFFTMWNFFGGINYFTKPGAFVVALRIALSLILGCTIGYVIGMVKTVFWLCKFVAKLAIGQI